MAPLGEGDTATVAIEETRAEDGTISLRITGELDLSNVDSLRPTLDSLVGSGPDVVVFDLGDLDFMDSSGIALLVETAGRVGRVEIHQPSTIIRRVIESTGLADVLHLDP
jgi:anti-anti-sigma factor